MPENDTFETDTPTPPDGADPGSTAFPWPPRPDDSVFEAWGRTWSGASLAPRRFFAALPPSGSLGAAVLYYLSIGIPVAGVQLFWSMLRGGSGDDVVEAGNALAAWGPLVDFLISPIYLLLSLFLSAGVVHLMLKLFGVTGGFGVTARTFAFAYSPQILGIVPVAGAIAGFIWMVVVAIVGVREAHGTTTGRAAAAILIPLSIALAFVAAAYLIVQLGGLPDVPM
ncbi:MAG TPA: Yip1 family protein [Longimicrobiales bacterium]|nr:Yip1 family protein [Longimicrobiales bacterium]